VRWLPLFVITPQNMPGGTHAQARARIASIMAFDCSRRQSSPHPISCKSSSFSLRHHVLNVSRSPRITKILAGPAIMKVFPDSSHSACRTARRRSERAPRSRLCVAVVELRLVFLFMVQGAGPHALYGYVYYCHLAFISQVDPRHFQSMSCLLGN
jgi:hypothetical protein